MTTRFLNTTLIPVLFLTLVANGPFAAAQHSDIEFEYENDKIAIEFGAEGRVYEAEFATSDPLEQETDDPGIASEVAEGLGVNSGDTIDYLILGPLEYHNGTDFEMVPTGASISIGASPSGSLTVDENTTGPVDGPGVIDVADSLGNIHDHLEFELNPISLDTAEYGAYALLMQLTTDASGVAPSDSFYIVFNFGLEEAVFENAVEAFAAKVPEPTSLVLAATMALGLCLRSRRLGS